MEDDYSEIADEPIDNSSNMNYNNIKNNKQSSNIKRYTELLRLSKEIAKIGSKTQSAFETIERELNCLLNKYRDKPTNGEIREAIGRKRGRPPYKKQYKNSLMK